MTLSTHRSGDTITEYRLDAKTDAETLLFLHGLGANRSQFDAEHTAFADNYQVLSCNLRGHGGSASAQEFSLAGCASDVLALLDHLGIERFHLVGNSMGGNVAYELLARAEPRLLTMCTFGTTADFLVPRPVYRMMRGAYRMTPMRWIARMASKAGRNADSKLKIRDMMRAAKKRTLLDAIPALATLSYLPTIQDSHVPFMLLQGEQDKSINRQLASTLAALNARGGFQHRWVGEAGHFLNLDQPERFEQLLRDFMQQSTAQALPSD